MKTDREKAMEWWNSMTFEERFYKTIKNNEWIEGDHTRHPDSLTGREIEIIWRKETKQKPNDILGCEAFADKTSLTITVKRPILYTEEEVFNLCYSAMKEIDYTPLCFFQEWFNQNKKK